MLRLRRPRPEKALQKQCVKWLRENGYLVVCSPNDMVLSGTAPERARQMNGWKARGFSPGFPDLFVFQMGSTMRLLPELGVTSQSSQPQGMSVGGLGIELKVGNNQLSPAQSEWRDELRRRGYAYVVVRSLDQLIAYVRLHHGQGVTNELLRSVGGID